MRVYDIRDRATGQVVRRTRDIDVAHHYDVGGYEVNTTEVEGT